MKKHTPEKERINLRKKIMDHRRFGILFDTVINRDLLHEVNRRLMEIYTEKNMFQYSEFKMNMRDIQVSRFTTFSRLEVCISTPVSIRGNSDVINNICLLVSAIQEKMSSQIGDGIKYVIQVVSPFSTLEFGDPKEEYYDLTSVVRFGSIYEPQPIEFTTPKDATEFMVRSVTNLFHLEILWRVLRMYGAVIDVNQYNEVMEGKRKARRTLLELAMYHLNPFALKLLLSHPSVDLNKTLNGNEPQTYLGRAIQTSNLYATLIILDSPRLSDTDKAVSSEMELMETDEMEANPNSRLGDVLLSKNAVEILGLKSRPEDRKFRELDEILDKSLKSMMTTFRLGNEEPLDIYLARVKDFLSSFTSLTKTPSLKQGPPPGFERFISLELDPTHDSYLNDREIIEKRFHNFVISLKK